ncbi:MAG: hypothetical protein K2N71_02275 [Oscillospiraceae bacterium]|nr:hypothetical protein [Oscillospiraceae bacterium]
MSKSINDYKEAMDNIKISESFYKRTEVLLTEIPEVKIEKRPVISSRRISAVIMSAAACVICIFGVKLAVDGRQSGIVTETVTGMDGREAVSLTDTDKGADELIDDFGEYDDAGIIAESIAPDSLDGGKADDPEQEIHDSAEPVAANPVTSSETKSAETKTTAPAAETKPTTTTTATEKRVVQGIDPYGVPNPGASPSEPNDADEAGEPAVFDEEPAEEPINPGASGVGSDSADIEEDDEDTEYDEAAPAAAAAGTENTKLFSELSLNNVTVDITPYFNMGNIKSGEGTIKKSGTEFKPVLDLIADMDSSATKIGNGSFTSLFSIRIYDENIDLEFYSIYLTNHESIVITKHSPDGSQVRATYALRREYYESLRHQLFLLFGAEGDYELFTNLIGGK